MCQECLQRNFSINSSSRSQFTRRKPELPRRRLQIVILFFCLSMRCRNNIFSFTLLPLNSCFLLVLTGCTNNKLLHFATTQVSTTCELLPCYVTKPLKKYFRPRKSEKTFPPYVPSHTTFYLDRVSKKPR